MKYHHGVTIRDARESLNMTQAQLAEQWPQASGGTGVSVNYVSDVERGKKHITDQKTLRRLCNILQIPLWKVGLSDYDPSNPNTFCGTFMYDETLSTAESLIKRTWNLRRVMSLQYVEEAVDDLNRLFDSLKTDAPPPVRLDERFQILYAQLLRLNAVVDVENQRYDKALSKFKQMNEIAKAIDHPATLAMSYMNIGTELERMGKQEEAIDYLERARDESFRASKHIMVVTNAYLARVYASAGQKLKFERAINAAIRTAKSMDNFYYGDGTDFVFHSFSGVLAEKSYGHLEVRDPKETLLMKDEIKSQIALEGNIWLDAWIPLDWARAHLMLGQIDESVLAGIEFYQKAKKLGSPHAKSRAYRLLNTIESEGYSDIETVRNFRNMLDNEGDQDGLKELDARYPT
ncbi:helix-turn-helix domain-containing protein [Hazenella sp. IB182357]|uniref:Helix-turn-helix domain-containing protein n=1 Tax=Polycladospora coralii TaxID=2771432 RepID=A0A926NBG7_9BACL|nr:helix-turn-helix domain-containing protein [Polycladospora coralii]MBD1373836.1 helix-turn-helix domain-containing protein [Polycladospora coralii]